MEREGHALYEGALFAQRHAKGFRLMVFTDHRNNTFRGKVAPSRRISKNMLRIAIELDAMNAERVYIRGEDHVLSDGPSRAQQIDMLLGTSRYQWFL